MSKYPLSLLKLVALLKKFPGVGGRTAERFAFHLLNWPESQLRDLAESVATVKEKIKNCPACHCLIDSPTCPFCDLSARDSKKLCILASEKEVFAIEETGTYRGLYHVLGGVLSPLEGRHPQHLHLESLHRRIQTLGVQEVIIALDSTLEGDTTALFLKEQLKTLPVTVSRLAFGLPMGSSLDFVDGGTLSRAFLGRQGF